ncbi:MAG: hypothetical protein KAI47_11015 [Deltaproteobacteria bacterium]|nr:hypothetical protein [Deltaproteobacteria bacterium]
MNRTSVIALIGALVIGTAGYALARGGGRGRGHRRVEACNGKAVGDACSFQSRRRGAVKGTCTQGRDNALFCRPNFRRGNRGKNRGNRGDRQAASTPSQSSSQTSVFLQELLGSPPRTQTIRPSTSPATRAGLQRQ